MEVKKKIAKSIQYDGVTGVEYLCFFVLKRDFELLHISTLACQVTFFVGIDK